MTGTVVADTHTILSRRDAFRSTYAGQPNLAEPCEFLVRESGGFVENTRHPPVAELRIGGEASDARAGIVKQAIDPDHRARIPRLVVDGPRAYCLRQIRDRRPAG